MGITYEEAIARVTGPGSSFETTEAEIRGERLIVFKSTPPSLRALFAVARARGDQTFLVYEDERWSFAETMRHADALADALVHRFGVAPGDRVAIAMRNYPEWISAFAAVTSVGAGPVATSLKWRSTLAVPLSVTEASSESRSPEVAARANGSGASQRAKRPLVSASTAKAWMPQRRKIRSYAAYIR